MFLVPDFSDMAVKTALTLQLMSGVSLVLAPLGIELILGRLKSSEELPENFNVDNIDGGICENWPKSKSVVKAICFIPHVWCLSTPLRSRLGDQVFLDYMLVGLFCIEFMERHNFKDVLPVTNMVELPQKNRALAMQHFCAERGISLQIHKEFIKHPVFSSDMFCGARS